MRAVRAHATRGRGGAWCLAALVLALEPAPLPATWAEVPGPTPAMLAAWRAYIEATEKRIDSERAGPDSRVSAELVRGEVAIDEMRNAPGQPSSDVPDGRIHHWRGRVFVPDTSLERLLETVRDPANHQQEDVLDARLIARDGPTDRVYLKITRSALVTATYNTEHTVTYRTLGPTIVVSRSEATKIAELEHEGTRSEREKPPGTDRGFLWKMNAYWRYQSVDGGVLVTLESVTLSRGVPWAISPIASPIVNRVARESVARTLRALRARF